MSEAPSALGRRVIVTGLAGSGKSTLSLALAAKTGLPVIHLDLHFWKPGWVAPSETEWREKQCGVLAGNAWIADGNYPETLDLRLERADTVVFLDLPWWLCAGRAFLRGFRMPGELPEGCDYPAWLRLRDEWRWPSASGENAGQSRSASTRSFRGTVSMWPFTCSDPSGPSGNSSTVWTLATWKPTTVDPAPSDSPLTPVPATTQPSRGDQDGLEVHDE
jgi:adenylate kinase family enzyme